MSNNRITVGIVDDHTLFRKGVISLLNESDEIDVVLEAANGSDMISKINMVNMPEVILMDINMPVMDGYAATAWLRDNCPLVRILALSMFEDDHKIIQMLRNGAGGYLLKESKTTELLNAIGAIREHGYFLNEMVSAKLLRNIQHPTDEKEQALSLSTNEIRFLQLCCSELTYKEIAGEMHLSPHTIDNYRQDLFLRFDIRSRTGLVLFALKNKLINLP